MTAVLATGAWLKNAACRLDGTAVRWSVPHGDLGTPQACVALDASVHALLAIGPVAAIAHDLHPDFHSTRLAIAQAARLGVPAIGVQHHHAHVAVALAESGHEGPAIGLALDGVGLGDDGGAWGGEVLRVDGARMRRIAHLAPLRLPGGDRAAREPWRMVAAALHALGRDDEIVPRLAPRVGEPAARAVAGLLARGLNSPVTTSAGRWFDAAAGALRLADRQHDEAQAAIALEQAASRHAQAMAAAPADGDAVPAATAAVPVRERGAGEPAVIDLRPLLAMLLDAPATDGVDALAFRFHAALADALVRVAADAAQRAGGLPVVLSGGCFFNRLLAQRTADGLAARGLRALRPQAAGPGDAGLALGQAWVARQALRAGQPRTMEVTTCA